MRARARLNNGIQQREKNGMLCQENPQFTIATPCIARLKVCSAGEKTEQLSLSENSHFPVPSPPPSEPSSPSPSPPVPSAINMSAFLSVVKIVTVDTLQVNFCENGAGEVEQDGICLENLSETKTVCSDDAMKEKEEEEKEKREEMMVKEEKEADLKEEMVR